MKIDRYYVDEGNPNANVVVRDRMSPMSKLTYPTDIAVAVTMGMFNDRKATISIAEHIAKILNEETS